MKLWRCDKRDPALGALVSWHPSKDDAQRELTAHQRKRADEADGPEGIKAVDVPTTKQGLIQWLNSNLDTDNG